MRGDIAFITSLANQWRALSSFYALPEFDQAFTADNAADVLKALSSPPK